LCRKYI